MKQPGNVFITGATSGIGEACAIHLSELGYRVFGAARSAAPISELRGILRSDALSSGTKDRAASAVKSERAVDAVARPYTLFSMDVRDDGSVEEGIAFLAEQAGQIDVVINNAGMAVGGPAEELTPEEVRDQFETNFFGIHRVCRAVIPLMRARNGGLIINVGSLGGLMGIPFQSVYSATKYAVEGYSESLQMEVRPFGIRVVVVEPGDTRTGFTANRKDSTGTSDSSPYAARFRTAITTQSDSEQKGWAAQRVARTIGRIVRSRVPRFRYKPAPFIQRISPYVRRIIPDRLYLKFVSMFYGL